MALVRFTWDKVNEEGERVYGVWCNNDTITKLGLKARADYAVNLLLQTVAFRVTRLSLTKYFHDRRDPFCKNIWSQKCDNFPASFTDQE